MFRRSVLAVAAVFVLVSTAFANEERELQNKPVEKIDAVLVLDASGSMLVTDPLRLRYEGAKLLAQFLKSGDRVAIVSFAESATVIRDLTEFAAGDEVSIQKSIEGIQSTGQYTNIHAGIQKARQILENSPRNDAAPAIILLSDGKMEPDGTTGTPEKLTSDLTETVLPELRKGGIKIYTLAFSDQADKGLLQEIAALTDGINWFTPTADQIHESFANLFLAVKKPQVVPLTKRGFKIDADVQEATFYINREDAEGEVSLLRPNGARITSASNDPSIKWFNGQKFDVVTIAAPEAGDWQIEGIKTNDGFATVLTNLKLVTDWPSNIYGGEKTIVEARLYEQDKPVSLPAMSGVIKYGFQITPTDKVSEPVVREFLFDDGSHGDKVEGDGVFTNEVILEEPGEYKLRVLAKAPTFERNQQLPFRVKPPIIALSVEDPESEGEFGHGEHAVEHSAETAPAHDQHAADTTHGESHEKDSIGTKHPTSNKVLVANLSEETSAFKKVLVKLYAVNAQKDRIEIPITQSKHSRLKYIAEASLLPNDGKYSLTAVLVGEGKRAAEVRYNSKTIEFEKISGDGEPEQEIKVVEKKEEEVPASPVLPIILMTLLNVGGVAGIYFLLKGQKVSEESELPELPSSEKIAKAIELLRARMEVSEIDLTLPVFTDPNYIAPPLYSGAGAVTASLGASGESSPQSASGEENGAEGSEETEVSENDVAAEEDSTSEVTSEEEPTES